MMEVKRVLSAVWIALFVGFAQAGTVNLKLNVCPSSNLLAECTCPNGEPFWPEPERDVSDRNTRRRIRPNCSWRQCEFSCSDNDEPEERWAVVCGDLDDLSKDNRAQYECQGRSRSTRRRRRRCRPQDMDFSCDDSQEGEPTMTFRPTIECSIQRNATASCTCIDSGEECFPSEDKTEVPSCLPIDWDAACPEGAGEALFFGKPLKTAESRTPRKNENDE